MTPKEGIAPRPIPPHIPGPAPALVGCRCFKPRTDGQSSVCIKCRKPFDSESRRAIGHGPKRGEAFAGKHRIARVQRFEAKRRKKKGRG
jgi:hypothetical protein